MKPIDQLAIQANKILGEYTGTLEGICAWDIPTELRTILKAKIKKLNETKIERPDKKSTYE